MVKTFYKFLTTHHTCLTIPHISWMQSYHFLSVGFLSGQNLATQSNQYFWCNFFQEVTSFQTLNKHALRIPTNTLSILTLCFLFHSTFFSRQCSCDGLGCKHQRQRQVNKLQFAQTMHKRKLKLQFKRHMQRTMSIK